MGITKVPFKTGVIYTPPIGSRDGVCFTGKPWSASTTSLKVVDSTHSQSVALAIHIRTIYPWWPWYPSFSTAGCIQTIGTPENSKSLGAIQLIVNESHAARYVLNWRASMLCPEPYPPWFVGSLPPHPMAVVWRIGRRYPAGTVCPAPFLSMTSPQFTSSGHGSL